jgi:hypothetical protein
MRIVLSAFRQSLKERYIMTMTKELSNINAQIARLEEQTKSKSHGKDSNELKLLSQLSELYKKRNQLKVAVSKE